MNRTAQLDIKRVLAALRQCFSLERHPVSLHEPTFSGNEWAYVKQCLDTGWVSSNGEFVDRFEEALAAYVGIRRAVVVVNGTAALHMALLLAGVAPGDEVLVPSLTFVATANAVTYCGAVPHFVEVEPRTLGVDTQKLEIYLERIATREATGYINQHTGRRLHVVVPMHTFGHPVQLDALSRLCKRFRLTMVEDAAEALGSRYKGQHVGTWGRLAVLSFNGNKTITTGGGGALLTHEDTLADKAKHLTTTAKEPHPWAYFHDYVGYNYRMPNLNAALGLAQLEQLPGFLARKKALATRYAHALSEIPGVTFIQEPDEASSNYWLNALLLDEQHAEQRDALLQAAHDAGIFLRPAWVPLHQLPMYQDCPRMELPVTESLAGRLVNLPSSAFLIPSEEQQA